MRHSVLDRPVGITGTLRVGRRTASLLPRLRPGDIAVLDQLDLDRATAHALVERGVLAVVDAAPSISGRYPNLGPEVLAAAGVLLVDDVGTQALAALEDGQRARVHDGEVVVDGRTVATGRALDRDRVSELMTAARDGLATQLESFTHNTTEFLRREQELLLHGQGIPETSTAIDGRPVVVVTRDNDYREQLRGLAVFLREKKPVLIGVDAGADALLAAGHRPDLVIVGGEGLAPGSTAGPQGSTVGDRALKTAREVVLHADRSGRAVGADRLERLGVRHLTVSASGLTEDLALLLADARGASLIVTVGTHATLEEFLDRQRAGLAGTFLTRLRVGPTLVDAGSIPQLYSGRVRLWQLLLVLVVGLLALGCAVALTPVGSAWWDSLRGAVRGLLPGGLVGGLVSGMAGWLGGIGDGAVVDRLGDASAWVGDLLS